MPRSVPEWDRIAADLRRKIRSGELEPGSQLPTREDLAVEYRVSLQPVIRALQELGHEGYVIGRQGKGTFVAEHPPQEGDAT